MEHDVLSAGLYSVYDIQYPVLHERKSVSVYKYGR